MATEAQRAVVAESMATYAARRARLDRLLLAVHEWPDAALDWLAEAVESGQVFPPLADGECAGSGACHGAMGWCDTCGDVSATCDDTDCSVHRCIGCGLITSERIDGQPWCAACRLENDVETVGDDDAEAASGEED